MSYMPTFASQWPAHEAGRITHDSGARARILITGASGVIGTIAAQTLGRDFELVGLDLVEAADPSLFAAFHIGSVANLADVECALDQADYVLHLATGGPLGWPGLVQTEIEGTRNVLEGAIAAGVTRVVLASSNHTHGCAELDLFAHRDVELPVRPGDAPRPDGLYGAAKVALEALGRVAAESTGLAVSVLRIGTMRLDDHPSHFFDDHAFGYIGSASEVEQRLERSWLFHEDFNAVVREELQATETFRLRFAASNDDESVWSKEIFTWIRGH
ncbi:MAG TPA: NAD(P)-dependent oxidoreductase [Acidimicrobiales bacterium]|nr:NAD(P)-dependent oxidoreductase [Acidimicrobiales bacterium]